MADRATSLTFAGWRRLAGALIRQCLIPRQRSEITYVIYEGAATAACAILRVAFEIGMCPLFDFVGNAKSDKRALRAPLVAGSRLTRSRNGSQANVAEGYSVARGRQRLQRQLRPAEAAQGRQFALGSIMRWRAN